MSIIKSRIFTGIGSRDTPLTFLYEMKNVASELFGEYSYSLRSGGARGSDTLFEQTCNDYKKSKEIFLPWKNFNSNPSPLYTIGQDALDLAKFYHPKWSALTWAGQRLMARNCYQVLGQDLKTPSDFILCYTKDGKGLGGTGQALRIADDYNIPIFDFGKKVYDIWEILDIYVD